MSTLPTVFVLGAGPIGQALVRDLVASGVSVSGVWARREVQAQAAGQGAGVASYSGTFPDAIEQADVLILAVRDSAISELSEALLSANCLRDNHVLLHCSGASSATRVFSPVLAKVAGVGTIHPLAAMANVGGPPSSLLGLRYGIEGDVRGRAVAKQLCSAMSGVALELRASQMAGYHAAASIASNFLVALLDSSRALLEAQGIDAELAMPSLCDLAIGAIENVRERGLPGALTGPIRRGDTETVRGHLQAITTSCPEIESVYRELGLAALKLADGCGDITDTESDELRDLLEIKKTEQFS
ncbi:MAG: DUF2520 domain-containing protein [Kofleriaceae bacterium]|nr:DUF2520 domain-containing protein [Kofleriaceae bacterium]